MKKAQLVSDDGTVIELDVLNIGGRAALPPPTPLITALQRLNPPLEKQANIFPLACRISIVAAMMQLSDRLPAARSVGTDAGQEELAALERQLMALQKLIGGLHEEAIKSVEAVGGKAPHPLALKDGLEDLARAARSGRADLSSRPSVPSNAKTLSAPEVVARLTARAFVNLTGRRPARSGRKNRTTYAFTDFLRDVFAAVGIAASADHHARKVVEES